MLGSRHQRRSTRSHGASSRRAECRHGFRRGFQGGLAKLQRIRDIPAMTTDHTAATTEGHDGLGDTITLSLDGEVRLADWVVAVRELQQMVDALAGQLSADSDLDWVVDDLRAGSALATIRGVGDTEAVHRVVRGYERVGESLQRCRPVPFGPKVSVPAKRIARLVNASIPSVRFETAARDFIVRARGEPVKASKDIQRDSSSHEAWGMIEGRVQTVTTRGSFRFTLYDSVFDRAVSCYLSPEHGPTEMLDLWDKMARVEGWIARSPETGRPYAVRRIRSIVVIGGAVDFRTARGVLSYDPTRRPEELIRRARDE